MANGYHGSFFHLPLMVGQARLILSATNISITTMADNRTQIDPRYLKYNKDEVEQILDGAVQMTENDDPMSLVGE